MTSAPSGSWLVGLISIRSGDGIPALTRSVHITASQPTMADLLTSRDTHLAAADLASSRGSQDLPAGGAARLPAA